jgi:Rha family phage regulatory protein
MNKQVQAVQPFQFHPVVIEDSKTLTTSLNVAKHFSKEHRKVCRDIEKLEVPSEFSTANFGRSDYVDSRGKKQKMYKMTRDGFVILVMGYTGPKAMRFKLAYIDAFNFMEWKLSQPVREREAKMMAYYEREAVRAERRANKFSSWEYDRMVEMYNSGHRICEIASLMQRSASTIQEHMRNARKEGRIEADPAQARLFPGVQ